MQICSRLIVRSAVIIGIVACEASRLPANDNLHLREEETLVQVYRRLRRTVSLPIPVLTGVTKMLYRNRLPLMITFSWIIKDKGIGSLHFGHLKEVMPRGIFPSSTFNPTWQCGHLTAMHTINEISAPSISVEYRIHHICIGKHNRIVGQGYKVCNDRRLDATIVYNYGIA